MPDTVDKPVVVSSSQGTIDAVMASMRYLVVVLAGFSALLGFLQNQDIVGLLEYIRGTEGTKFIAAVVAVGTMIYGIFKTHKRGAQTATVAEDSRVPSSVAHTK